MINFRCTQRVLKRFKPEIVAHPPPSTSIFGDWYANLLNFGPHRFVICVSEALLTPVILPARNSDFPERFPLYLAEVLNGLGIPSERFKSEISGYSSRCFAKTANRSLLGTVNDFSYLASHHLGAGDSILQAALALAETPCGPNPYRHPDELTLEAFAVNSTTP